MTVTLKILSAIKQMRRNGEKQALHRNLPLAEEAFARHDVLLDYGIDWKSPHMMNPRVMFD